jgi:hypothetical protein
MNGDWEELKGMFCLAFFPMTHINSLPRAILDFKQREKESIGISWARFYMPAQTCHYPRMCFFHLFYTGLDIADLCLDMTARGKFTHKPMMEQVELKKHTHFF